MSQQHSETRRRGWLSPQGAAVLTLLLIVVVAAGALGFRLPRLSDRPFHGDEAVQATKAGKLLFEQGHYRYDPNDHHGPTLYYLAQPFIRFDAASRFAETDEATYRRVTVLFGVGLILLLPLVAGGMDRRALLVAALLTAVSPAMVFYSRYFIQEALLVFFTFAAIAAGWRYLRAPGWGWALVCGASLGLMHATKETCILAHAAMGGAIALAVLWERLRDGRVPDPRPCIHKGHAAGLVVAALLASVVFFSSFFTNLRGPLDSILAYGYYLKRADGAGLHDHPWRFYLEILTFWKRDGGPRWSEGLILALAAVGIVDALRRRQGDGRPGDPRLARFLAFYAPLLTAFYSAITYKTPWCVLGFLHGYILLAGIGAVALLRAIPPLPVASRAARQLPRALAGAVVAAFAVQLAFQAYRANFDYDDDPRNPYVYAHSVRGVVRTGQRAEDLAALHPDGYRMLIRVVMPGVNYWPLPWYLRRFERVGYWNEIPEDVDAPLLIIPPRIAPEIQPRLRDTYQTEFQGLRPNVNMLLFIEAGLWEKFMETRR